MTEWAHSLFPSQDLTKMTEKIHTPKERRGHQQTRDSTKADGRLLMNETKSQFEIFLKKLKGDSKHMRLLKV